MSIKLKFDMNGHVENPTFVLTTKAGKKLGSLPYTAWKLSDGLNRYSELFVSVSKMLNGTPFHLWNKIKDFKLVYCPTWKKIFEIKVELNETDDTLKNITGQSLGESELSQVNVYGVEINTEDDMLRDSYTPAIFYDPTNFDSCIIGRILKSAPHYKVKYVDESIAKLQRTFAFDNISVYDAFMEISEEIECLFDFETYFDKDGKIVREISVYDLKDYCWHCGERGAFIDKCNNCGNQTITKGYGDDTTIYVAKDNLANDITYYVDTDSVKNCFKLVAGDESMTAAISSCNPNGSNYLWYITDEMKEDMSAELVEKLAEYEKKSSYYQHDHVISSASAYTSKYNDLAKKYSAYSEDIEPIPDTISGFSALMEAYYNTIDLYLLLNNSLMPDVKLQNTDANQEASKLTVSNLGAIAVTNVDTCSTATASSAALSVARTIVDSRYQVKVKDGSLSGTIWTGNFTVTNYSNEEDSAESQIISLSISDDLETFIKQKIEKVLNNEQENVYGISALFKLNLQSFSNELKKYSLVRLTSFNDACQACLNVLIEQGIADQANDFVHSNDLYTKLYLPYYEKLSAIQSEIGVRESEIEIITGKFDPDGNVVADGLQTIFEKERATIQKSLDFEKYVGTELWAELISYRRDDTYQNDNFVSDGLNNSELFRKAEQFVKLAKEEARKSAIQKHVISSTLKNFLAMQEFAPIVNHFKLGNWLRLKVDDEIFKLRLIGYEIDSENLEQLNVEFSDATKASDPISDVKDILEQATSLSSNFPGIARQAEKGNNANGAIAQWLSGGLNSALVRIQNNNSEEITITKNGVLCRSYDDIDGTYSPEQLKITHNVLGYTDDNWKTVKLAIGKHDYVTYSKNSDAWVYDTGYGVSADFVTAGQIMGSRIVGGEIYSSNYHKGIVGSTTNSPKGTYINLATGYVELGSGRMIYDPDTNVLSLNGVKMDWNNTNPPAIDNVEGLGEYIEKVGNLEAQLDKRAETWYQSEDPSVAWTDNETKELHTGDLWHYTGETSNVNGIERTKNSEWIWEKVGNSYQWSSIEISDDVFDAIDGKAQIFTSTPEPPYNIGDLWVQGSNGDIMNCVRARQTGVFDESDWEKSSKYTDDAVAKEALEKAKKAIDDAATGIDLADAAQKAAKDAKDAADGAVAAAGEAESNANNYTDASTAAAKKQIEEDLTSAYQNYTNSKVSELDTAVQDYLFNDGKVLIDDKYIVSPYIGGGYLNIVNVLNGSKVIIDPNNLTGTGYIFQVQNLINGEETITVGVDVNGNATFTGTITGSSFVGGTIKAIDDGGTCIDLKNDIITLGRQNDTSVINLCGGLGRIKYSNLQNDEIGGQKTSGLQISNEHSSSPDVVIRTYEKGTAGVYLYSGDNYDKSFGQYGMVRCTNSANINLVAKNWSTNGSFKWSKIDLTWEYININSNANLYLKAGTNCYLEGTTNAYITAGNEVQLQNKNTSILFQPYNAPDSSYNAFFKPSEDGKVTLGTSQNKWNVVYAANSTIQTSDRREKENIISLDTSELFDKLKPVQYNFIKGNKKKCYGLIAQDVIESLKELGIDENELDLVHHDRFPNDETGEEEDTYGIAYTNLIAMLIHEVQKLKSKIK